LSGFADKISQEPSNQIPRFTSSVFEADFRLLQNGLQGFRFNFTMHRHAWMKLAFDVMVVRSCLSHKFKTEPLQRATDFFAGKVARPFHAG